jgi:hypothetical protein
MTDTEILKPFETEKATQEENNEKENKQETKEENSLEKKEEEKKDEKKDEKEDEEDSQKKLIKSINELPSESIKAKSIILYDLNEDMKSQYLDKYKSERTAIELKELDNFLNYFNKIRDIINSSSDKKETILSLISDQNKEKYSISSEEKVDDKSEFTPIKNFWYISLVNAKFFEFNEKDKKILEHLIDIKFIPMTFPSFKIELIFEENDYLEDNVIYKIYHFHENDKDFLEKIEGCKIKWKDEEKNPTIKTVVKHKKKKKEYITKNVKSFFNIFETKDKENNLDKELVEAQFFRNDFLENMLEYYLNIMEITYHEEEDDD